MTCRPTHKPLFLVERQQVQEEDSACASGCNFRASLYALEVAFLPVKTRCERGVNAVSNCKRTLTAIWKPKKNVLSLYREKRGYAPCAYPLFCTIDYQRLTGIKSVHAGARGCTCRRYSPYSSRDGAGLRLRKSPFPCPEARTVQLNFHKNSPAAPSLRTVNYDPLFPCRGERQKGGILESKISENGECKERRLVGGTQKHARSTPSRRTGAGNNILLVLLQPLWTQRQNISTRSPCWTS